MNTNKLRAKIVERGYNVGTFADKLGVNRSNMYKKLENGRFLISEVKDIKNALSLTNEEAIEIFLS